MEMDTDSQDSFISNEMNASMSSVAKFDDWCRFQSVNDCCDEGVKTTYITFIKLTDSLLSPFAIKPFSEFLTFALSQEDCRLKWLAAEREVQKTHALINQLQKDRGKLEVGIFN